MENDQQAVLSELQAENARLIGLLEAHGIEWRVKLPAPVVTHPTSISTLSTAEKVTLFRSLFQGRTDVYPTRWESKATGKSGYSPVCGNEWQPGICHKPKVKCADCEHRLLMPVTDTVIYAHLSGAMTAGVYPLLEDDACYFLAVDFDEKEWRDDVRAFLQSCRTLGVPAVLEISRSGNGAHAWIFFTRKVSARDARRLGTALLSHTCSSTRQLELSSYDRLFPNQDSMPKGGFGNLIALPLQKRARENNGSVFVDEELRPYPDQWAFLASVTRMSAEDIEPVIVQAIGGSHPLDVTFIEDEEQSTPWKKTATSRTKIPGPMPERLRVTLGNLVYFEKAELPQALANRLIRLAAFQNPEFYKAQAMRFPVWDKPRVIGCAENFPRHIGLPRGCLDTALELLAANNIEAQLQDERYQGEPIHVNFGGTLRLDQEAAIAAMLHHDVGVLCAPTAFGKTVTAAAMIARRGVNTLILVHRTELLKQWQERLQVFLGAGKGLVGCIGGGKNKPTGKIDIAVMQSLSRKGEISSLIENYGQVIVDECHHVGAVSFDLLLKRAKAKYVLGLTATPIRRDGQQPIIFMQCGPIRYTAERPATAPHVLEVYPRYLSHVIDVPGDAGIQDVFRHLSADGMRTQMIVDAVTEAFRLGRKVLVLTERTEHLDMLQSMLQPLIASLFVLHGRMSRKQRTAMVAELNGLLPDSPRVLLATGKLVGEGFDHPPLDTLVLAMPVSWKGTLQQYAGRLHREHAEKTDVRIIDFIDIGHPALVRMWEKRQVGYRAMGYSIESRE
ncbi:TOTE conflict system archaeo-eukaryotic primase domain-containing protein [Chromobacterium alticapitis]|uniref:DEAD/DEAH box helicase n=1 Tax=Chromobacterium alticapitis TaxID=2073169 RepID=A0A2S5DAK2_9NEIS|nr:DEAD/DEAH box helicase family protein [Chromobacterium alticapitis]POZ60083.1 DEAD/DEAH box helicase [Chromobacterium alticapitis]